jgi:hypothetical protein
MKSNPPKPRSGALWLSGTYAPLRRRLGLTVDAALVKANNTYKLLLQVPGVTPQRIFRAGLDNPYMTEVARRTILNDLLRDPRSTPVRRNRTRV